MRTFEMNGWLVIVILVGLWNVAVDFIGPSRHHRRELGRISIPWRAEAVFLDGHARSKRSNSKGRASDQTPLQLYDKHVLLRYVV